MDWSAHKRWLDDKMYSSFRTSNPMKALISNQLRKILQVHRTLYNHLEEVAFNVHESVKAYYRLVCVCNPLKFKHFAVDSTMSFKMEWFLLLDDLHFCIFIIHIKNAYFLTFIDLIKYFCYFMSHSLNLFFQYFPKKSAIWLPSSTVGRSVRDIVDNKHQARRFAMMKSEVKGCKAAVSGYKSRHGFN